MMEAYVDVSKEMLSDLLLLWQHGVMITRVEDVDSNTLRLHLEGALLPHAGRVKLWYTKQERVVKIEAA
jgi:hypothetical protein